MKSPKNDTHSFEKCKTLLSNLWNGSEKNCYVSSAHRSLCSLSPTAYHWKSLSHLHITANPCPACISLPTPFLLAYHCKSLSCLHITANPFPACISLQIPFPLAYICKSLSHLHIPFPLAYCCRSLSRLHITANSFPACISLYAAWEEPGLYASRESCRMCMKVPGQADAAAASPKVVAGGHGQEGDLSDRCMNNPKSEPDSKVFAQPPIGKIWIFRCLSWLTEWCIHATLAIIIITEPRADTFGRR